MSCGQRRNHTCRWVEGIFQTKWSETGSVEKGIGNLPDQRGESYCSCSRGVEEATAYRPSPMTQPLPT